MKNVGIRLTWRQIHKNRSSCDPLPDGSIFIVQGKDKPPAGWYWAWLGKGGDVIARKGSKTDYAFLSCEAARESAENVFLNTIWAAYATS